MKAEKDIETRKWELAARSIFDNELVGDEDLMDMQEMGKLKELVSQVDLYFELKKHSEQKGWENVKRQMIKTPSKTFRIFNSEKFALKPFLKVAAMVVLAIVLGTVVYQYIRDNALSRQINEVIAGANAIKTIELPDGTVVSLNTNTRINYPERFSRDKREVSIQGEAFFEVKPNKHKPFIIHAGNAQIKVLGTSFNVNAYPEAEKVEVIVETGKVQVSNKVATIAKTNELILDPGDKGTLICASNDLLKTTNNDPNFLAWKTHNLIFRETSLKEVIANLEKVYKVDIVVSDDKLNNLLLSAQFNNYSVDFILKVIQTTFNLELVQANGQYILKAHS
jgi:ferric-dicitrate binding protein FerR (iron transport regulator)